MWGEAHETLSDCGDSIRLRVGAVLADTDPIAERRALMKHDGEAAKKLFNMSKGKAPFDLAAVKESLKTLTKGRRKRRLCSPTTARPAAAPRRCRRSGKTRRKSPRFAKFKKDVEAAQAGVVNEATFKKFGPTVFDNCGGCHELYKAKSGRDLSSPARGHLTSPAHLGTGGAVARSLSGTVGKGSPRRFAPTWPLVPTSLISSTRSSMHLLRRARRKTAGHDLTADEGRARRLRAKGIRLGTADHRRPGQGNGQHGGCGLVAH